MSLTDVIKKLLKRGKPAEPVPQREQFLAIVVPKKMLSDGSYRPFGIVNDDFGAYFDSCALDLARNFLQVYGPEFHFSREVKPGTAEYRICNGGTKLVYQLAGADRWFSPQNGESFSNDVRGLLLIEQETIDLQSAAKLLTAGLEHHLLHYQERHPHRFGVMYQDRTGAVTLEGVPLLKTLGIKPTEAAEFVSVMMYGRYVRREVQWKDDASPAIAKEPRAIGLN